MSDPSHRCERCRGRLFLEWDRETGSEWHCLNCGRAVPLAPVVPLPLTTNAGSRKKLSRSA